MEKNHYTIPVTQVIQLEVSSDVMNDIFVIRESTEEPEYNNQWDFEETDDDSGALRKRNSLWD